MARTHSRVLVLIVTLLAAIVPAVPATAQSPVTLQVEPEISGAAAGTNISVTGNLSSPAGTTITVFFEVVLDGEGETPAAPDATCQITQGSQSCSTTVTVPANGGDFYGFINQDGTFSQCDRVAPPCGKTVNEGQNEATAPGSLGEPDGTDVSTFQAASGVFAELDCEPDTQFVVTGGTPGAVTCTARDANRNPITLGTAVNLDAERAGAFDADGGFFAPLDHDNIATIGAGASSVTIAQAFLPARGTNGTDTLCIFADFDNDADFIPNGAPQDGGNCIAFQSSDAGQGTTDVVRVHHGQTAPTPTPVVTPPGQTPPPVVTPNPGPGTETGTVFRVSRSGRLRGLRRITVQDVGPAPATTVGGSATSGRGGRYTVTLPAGTYTKTASDRRGRYVCSIGSQGGSTTGTVVITAGATTIVDIFCER